MGFGAPLVHRHWETAQAISESIGAIILGADPAVPSATRFPKPSTKSRAPFREHVARIEWNEAATFQMWEVEGSHPYR